MSSFESELAALLNKYSLENESGSPDWVLASFLNSCLASYNTAVVNRQAWYGQTVDGTETVNPFDEDAEMERSDG